MVIEQGRHENPQVFISFKNLDSDGKPTRDSELANEIHDFFVSQGLRVFFSNISLEKLGTAAYQRAIDTALDSAKVLIAVGTSNDRLDSQWVRYEWNSFLNDILSGIKPEGRIFGYVENMPISSLPRGLRQSQVFSHGPGAMERLFNFVSNALGTKITDIEVRISQVNDCLQQVLFQGKSWQMGVVKAWRAADTQRLICQIEADWQSVTPRGMQELKDLGWSVSTSSWGLKCDKPRVWQSCQTDTEIRAIAEELILIQRVIFADDPYGQMVFRSLEIPKFDTPPWFTRRFMGGDVDITCKQCLFEDTMSYSRYDTKPFPGECPDCGLGRNDWCNYWHGKPGIQCKRCNYQGAAADGALPQCPECFFNGDMSI